MPVADRLFLLLDQRASAATLAVTRIGLGIAGAAAAFEAWRLMARVLAPLVMPLSYLPVSLRLPPGAVAVFVLTWAAAAAGFAAGIFTRGSGCVLVVLSAYALLLDQRFYSNHLYLLILLVLLVTVAGPGTTPSGPRDQRSGPKTVPAWPLFLLKVQVSLVYGFAAIAKLTPDFLSGAVLVDVMRSVVPRTPSLMTALAASTIGAELFVAIGLWNSRLRWLAAAVGLGLHAAMVMLINTGRLSLAIFALELLAVYPLFFHRPVTAPRP